MGRLEHDDNNNVVVYTDGECINNGRPGASAGYGVFWAPNHRDNVGYALKGDRQTNQRAELSAAIKAMKIALDRGCRHLTVRSDSLYVVEHATNFIDKWRSNGWRNSRKQPLVNADLWQKLDSLMDRFKRIKFEYIQAHCGEYGNEEADELAKMGVGGDYSSDSETDSEDDSNYYGY